MANDEIAWVTELGADDLDESWSEPERDVDDRWASGLFQAHLDHGRYVPGPSAVSIEEALAWARERAARVVVRVDRQGDHEFSAGSRQLGSLPPWPPEGFVAVHRRAAGYEYMDRTADDPPIAWTALVTVQRGWGPTPHGIPQALAAALATLADGAETRILDPGPGPWDRTEGIAWYAHPGVNGALGFGAVAHARFTVHAPTRDQAWQTARVHGEAALDQALCSVGVQRSSLEHDWDLDSITIYPEGSDLASWNCALNGT